MRSKESNKMPFPFTADQQKTEEIAPPQKTGEPASSAKGRIKARIRSEKISTGEVRRGYDPEAKKARNLQRNRY